MVVPLSNCLNILGQVRSSQAALTPDVVSSLLLLLLFLPACLSSPLHSCLSSFRPFFCPRNLKRPLSSSFVLRQPRLANCKKQGKKKFLGCVSSATRRKRRRRPSLPFFGSLRRFPPNEEAPPSPGKFHYFPATPVVSQMDVVLRTRAAFSVEKAHSTQFRSFPPRPT